MAETETQRDDGTEISQRKRTETNDIYACISTPPQSLSCNNTTLPVCRRDGQASATHFSAKELSGIVIIRPADGTKFMHMVVPFAQNGVLLPSSPAVESSPDESYGFVEFTRRVGKGVVISF